MPKPERSPTVIERMSPLNARRQTLYPGNFKSQRQIAVAFCQRGRGQQRGVVDLEKVNATWVIVDDSERSLLKRHLRNRPRLTRLGAVGIRDELQSV